MKNLLVAIIVCAFFNLNCDNMDDKPNNNTIKGYELLTHLTGHWVGTNKTAFGNFDWFAFDFRPISASHLHSIYEGGTNQNIITAVFIGDFEGEQQIMARNGGYLGSQYRATYFVLDKVEENETSKYYRLVDAIGKEKRAYMEFRFEKDTLYFDAYKDNSGTLDQPIHHMGFKGTNYNPSFAQPAIDLFNFPQALTEVSFENKMNDLIDPDSALFLEEDQDPFPNSQHQHLSDLTININRDVAITDMKLLLYISKEPIVNRNGQVDFEHLDKKVIRTIDVQADENFYQTTYLHPDTYFVTAFSDRDQNFYPSTGDISNVSKAIQVLPNSNLSMDIDVITKIP